MLYQYQHTSLVPKITFTPILIIAVALLLNSGCSSYEKIKMQSLDFEVPAQYFNASQETVWAASVEIFNRFQTNKAGEGGIDEQDQERGIIKTQWIDNTSQINFTDSFSTDERIRAAKMKLILTLEPVSKDPKKPQTKISIFKRQFVENDLFQGWKEIQNDYVIENTILYRIERLIDLDKKIAQLQKDLEEQKIQKLESAEN